MKKIRLFGKQWIFEGFLPGEKMGSLEGFSVEKEIFRTKTPYQELLIFENEEYGRILMLNGFVQLAEVGEEVYHEMLVHPALMLCKNPKRIMIIGGGDGGALREVLKHPIKEAVLVEIDREVIETSKRYLPFVSQGAFEDLRVTCLIEDAKNVVLKYEDYFDCIILDSNDPDGKMAEGLFSQVFFQKIKKALKKDGIFAAQTGYFSDPYRKKAQAEMRNVFPSIWTHRALVRYYPSDEHSFSFATSDTSSVNVSLLKMKERFEKRNLNTSYYSPEIHIASTILPPYLKREIEKRDKLSTLWESLASSLGMRENASQRNSNQE